MSEEEREVVKAKLVSRSTRFTLVEICDICGVQATMMIEMVDYGILDPEGTKPEQWQFDERALSRCRKALRIRRDLKVNLPGIALALDLLEEIDQLKREMS